MQRAGHGPHLGRSASTISRDRRRNSLAAVPYASHSARPAAKLDLQGVGWSVVRTLLQ